jgi:hypothetical protein
MTPNRGSLLVVGFLVPAVLVVEVGAWTQRAQHPSSVRGPDSWGMPAPGWWCFDVGSPLPHQWDAVAGDHVCTQAQVANERHASATP